MQRSRTQSDVFQQVFRLDDVDDSFDHRAGHWSATESRAEVVDMQVRSHRIGEQQRSDREARTQRLGGRDHVRRDAVQVRRKGMTRTANTALHLVEDQHCPGLAAALPQCLQQLLGQIECARDALNRLDDHSARLLGDRSARCLKIST